MKKIPFIAALVCALIFLGGCCFLGLRYETLDSRYQTLETEAFKLQEDNSALNNRLTDNTAALEEKESYLTGQKEYISELTRQLDSLSRETSGEDSDEDSDEEKENVFREDSQDPYPNLYAEKDETETEEPKKIAYLTFDDGPSNLTPQVLELLEQYNAKATFFVVCKNNEEYAAYLKDIVAAGHTLALHSYSHDYNLIYASEDAFLSDYEKVYDWVVENTGYTPSLFRFPGGSNNGSSYVVNDIISEMERRGFVYFDWNVSSGDGSNLTTTENIIDNICSNIKNVENPVVLMHDGSGKNATLAALPTVLKNLSEAGYEFHALDKTVEPVQYR